MRRAWLRLAAVAFSIVPAVSVSAQTVGSEFRVNTYTTNGQTLPSVAAAPDGSFVVAWESYQQVSPASKQDIFAQRFGGTGAPLGSEFRVNTTSTYNQIMPAVAVDAHGNFVVVWESGDNGGLSYHVYGQRFSSAGAPLGGEFRVNATTTNQNYGSVAMDANGDFVVVWTLLETGHVNVHGQRFSADGSPLGGAFRVNEDSSINNENPRAAMDAQGRFVVAWKRSPSVGSASDIAGRRFDTGGAPVGAEFRINTYTTGVQLDPAVARDAAGGFVVVWRSLGQDLLCGTGIHGQRFSAGGAPLGTEIAVSGVCINIDISQPSVASDPFGNFAVAWRVSNGYGGASITARRFTNVGDADASFVASSYTGSPKYPAVAAGYDGFTVVWQSPLQDLSFDGIYGQRFSPGLQGDVDGNGQVNVADVFYLINFLFAGGPPPIGASDANGDGLVNVADVFYLINFLFAGGAPPH